MGFRLGYGQPEKHWIKQQRWPACSTGRANGIGKFINDSKVGMMSDVLRQASLCRLPEHGRVNVGKRAGALGIQDHQAKTPTASTVGVFVT